MDTVLHFLASTSSCTSLVRVDLRSICHHFESSSSCRSGTSASSFLGTGRSMSNRSPYKGHAFVLRTAATMLQWIVVLLLLLLLQVGKRRRRRTSPCGSRQSSPHTLVVIVHPFTVHTIFINVLNHSKDTPQYQGRSNENRNEMNHAKDTEPPVYGNTKETI